MLTKATALDTLSSSSPKNKKIQRAENCLLPKRPSNLSKTFQPHVSPEKNLFQIRLENGRGKFSLLFLLQLHFLYFRRSPSDAIALPHGSCAPDSTSAQLRNIGWCFQILSNFFTFDFFHKLLVNRVAFSFVIVNFF